MESEFWAPETEHCLFLSDGSAKIIFPSKREEVEKKQKRLPGETAFFSEMEGQIKGVEGNRYLKRAHSPAKTGQRQY